MGLRRLLRSTIYFCILQAGSGPGEFKGPGGASGSKADFQWLLQTALPRLAVDIAVGLLVGLAVHMTAGLAIDVAVELAVGFSTRKSVIVAVEELPWHMPWRRFCGTCRGNAAGGHDKFHCTCCGHIRSTCRGSAMPDGNPWALPWQAAVYHGHVRAEPPPRMKCSETINRVPEGFVVFYEVLRLSLIHDGG